MVYRVDSSNQWNDFFCAVTDFGCLDILSGCVDTWDINEQLFGNYEQIVLFDLNKYANEWHW